MFVKLPIHIRHRVRNVRKSAKAYYIERESNLSSFDGACNTVLPRGNKTFLIFKVPSEPAWDLFINEGSKLDAAKNSTL